MSVRALGWICAGLIAASSGAAGCGYTFMTTGASIPSDVQTLHIAHTERSKDQRQALDALTRELRLVVRRHGRFRVVESPGAADAVLNVALEASVTRPVAFDQYDEVLDYETTMFADAKLETRDGRLLWSGDHIGSTRSHAAVAGAVVTTSSTFQSSERLRREDLVQFDTVQLGETRKEIADERLVSDLAEAIYERIMEGR